MDSLKFIVAELPPGINQIRKLEHDHMYGRERDRWQLLVRQAIGRQLCSFPGRVSIDYTAYRLQLADKDNNAGSFKLVGDALVKLCIIRDDGPMVVDEAKSNYGQSRILHYPDQRIEVTIMDLEEHVVGVLRCDQCGVILDPSRPYRLSMRSKRARCTKCYTYVNAELKREGLGPMVMTLIEPAQRRLEASP